MRRRQGRMGVVCRGAVLLAMAAPSHAIEVKVSGKALERTLNKQLFGGADGRYYIRGSASTVCWVYAEQPKVSFQGDRVVVHVHARARLGTPMHGACLGIALNTEADVSFLPEAEGESIGFRGTRVERLSESRELNFLLVPFLSHKLPGEMKVNAVELMRKVLTQSQPVTGYAVTLDELKLHSMNVRDGSLVVDADARMGVD